VRIFDKGENIVAHSHALTVHVRTQEVLEAMGIVWHWRELGQPFSDISVHAFGRHLATVKLAGIDGNPALGPLDIGQNVTKRLLVEHLASLGVTVERPIEVTSMAEAGDRVTATLRHRDRSRNPRPPRLRAPRSKSTHRGRPARLAA